MTLTPPHADLLVVGTHDPRPRLATLFGADFSALSLTPARGDQAPTVTRHALTRFSTYDAGRRLDLADWHVRELGDADAGHHDWEGACAAIGALASRAYAEDCCAIALGGDHSVTWPLVKAFREAHPDSRIGIVQLDVHHDVRPLDHGPSNGTPIRGLIEDGVVAPADVVQIGIHPFGNRGELARYCDEVGIRRHDIAAVVERGARPVARGALSQLVDCDRLYLTIDIDVLDRSFAPGTVAALPGGLTPHQLADLVDEIVHDPRVRALDIVEFDPTRDVQSTTAYNVALVLLTALSALARRKAS